MALTEKQLASMTLADLEAVAQRLCAELEAVAQRLSAALATIREAQALMGGVASVPRAVEPEPASGTVAIDPHRGIRPAGGGVVWSAEEKVRREQLRQAREEAERNAEAEAS